MMTILESGEEVFHEPGGDTCRCIVFVIGPDRVPLAPNRTLPGDVSLRTSRLLQVGASPRVADLLARGDRISAIKAYRQEHQVGLREGKEEIGRLERVLRHRLSA